MANNLKVTKTKLKKAIIDSAGILSIVAKRCGVERLTIYNYLERFPDLKELVQQEREKLIDLGEKGLLEKVQEKDFQAIKFLLGTIGRNRGFVERQEITHSTDNVTFQFVGMTNNYPAIKKIENKSDDKD